MTTVPRVRWVVLGVVLCVGLLALGLLVARQPLSLDSAIANALQDQWQHPVGTVASIVSDLLGPVLPWVFGAILFVAAVIAWRRGDRGRAAVLVKITAVVLLCRLTSVVLKPVFGRARPRDYPDFSFPSGHVVSTASTGFGAVLLCLWLAPRLLRRVAVIAVLATTLCAASRVVFGVHWLSDTVGAVFGVLGIGILAAVALRLLPKPPDPVSADQEAA
ncbi:phosphatase PAP2 family protein [Amycolatopsis sp.]|jgi:undecaprenyl-diphosphatase|uniref:phosphatase PAP2 family protein n=1 Tax=Amycolatopsis sp. TaxID=37632 RepID=UPI002E09653D|nr:phosphatase PAP2 family protein [Amycolatopsis sp.]